MVFSVTLFKIDWSKKQNWEKKGGKYAKPLTKIQVKTKCFTHIFTDLYGDAKLEPIRCVKS